MKVLKDKRHNSIGFSPTTFLRLRKLFFVCFWEKNKTASNMCWTGIWISPCRSTEFNFWTCGFGSRVRICSQAYVYPAWSKVQALLTQTCWQGARSVWFAVTVQEDDLLMMFLKCNRTQWGASFFPRLVPQRHQSLFCPLPLGDNTNQKSRELLHESVRATQWEKNPPTTTNINKYCVEAGLDWVSNFERSWTLSKETPLYRAAPHVMSIRRRSVKSSISWKLPLVTKWNENKSRNV